MKYEELEEQLLFINKASRDYLRFRKGTTEYEQEQAGFISGELNEAIEVLYHQLADTEENFNLILNFFEKHCPNTYDSIVSKLLDYDNLYDLFRDIKMEDGFIFPLKLIRKISIY